jgi:NTP pyrophosphatase (non-canonical NTP hydrolase)
MTNLTMLTNIWSDVLTERDRQETLKAAGKFPYTCADPELFHSERALILSEEVGEVARAILNDLKFATDGRPPNLRQELIQVMAVSLAWIEALDDAARQHMMASDSTIQEREKSVRKRA